MEAKSSSSVKRYVCILRIETVSFAHLLTPVLLQLQNNPPNEFLRCLGAEHMKLHGRPTFELSPPLLGHSLCLSRALSTLSLGLSVHNCQHSLGTFCS